MKNITPKKVTVKQGYEIILERQGFSRIINENQSVTMHYGKRPNGKKIYAVPVFMVYNQEIIGSAVSCA